MSDKIQEGTEWYMPGLPTVRVLGATEMVVAVVQPQTNASWAVHLEDFLRLYRPVAPKPCEPRCHCGDCYHNGVEWWGLDEQGGEDRRMTRYESDVAICWKPGCNTVLLAGGGTCEVVARKNLLVGELLTPDKEVDHAAD